MRSVSKQTEIQEKFKPFNETYKICAFALAVGLVYPNSKTLRKRVILVLIVIALNFMELYWYAWYLRLCFTRKDVYNFTRNSTVGFIITLFLFKSFYINCKNDGFEHILQEITNDLLHGNELPADYQEIYETFIKRAKVAQTCWTVIPILLGTQFTVYSAVVMIYEYMATDLSTRHMVHEMELKHIEHIQSKSPYFEVLYAINCIDSFILAPNFCGFDGSFCIAVTHMCLKLKILGHSVQRAFNDITDRENLRSEIKNLIKEHQKALAFYDNMQNVYGGWLFMVFLLTSLLISFNVYQIYYIQRIDPKYTVFALCAVMHMFLPCYYASDLNQVNDEFCNELYNARWEATGDPVVTRSLMLMICRSQQPLIYTGIGLVVFNMQLFISIMQTSYSFFTLISS